jgi:cytidylate kinase
MAKVSLAEHLQDRPDPQQEKEANAGPYVTISREFGCWGFSLGLLLLDVLNEEATEGTSWQIYHKEVLDRLAEETNVDIEVLEQQRRTKPHVIAEFFRSFGRKQERLPSGIEVRNRISEIIRNLAMDGGAIIVGQAGAGATQGLPNGITIRLEAPEEWRVKQIAFREGLSETEARLRIQAEERERDYLKKIYETRFPRKPAFNLVYDCSAFSLAQIAQHVVQAMKLKRIL